ncbi:BREX system P-loop protein BrxC [Phenylobacterium sp.]|uniref:BREX system P-loop protein BrxC n=1 Tax=Phenylobacterium sp. TaxID=1871053 RepID=UPI0025F0D3FC|nr:BREX system P-loop protein BrxC [Phenylobacterium sp.]
MLNKEVFHTDPAQYRLANQGVAKLVVPSPPEMQQVLRGELSTFVCDGRYAEGLTRILEAFLGGVGKGTAPAVWVSGFYGSGKSHLAAMLAALWTNVQFEDGATAEGLIQHKPAPVVAALTELKAAGKRNGGLFAAGGSMPGSHADPATVALGIILRGVGLPETPREAEIAFWLEDEGILDEVRSKLGATFNADIRRAVLSSRFADAVLAAKPSLGKDEAELRDRLKHSFPAVSSISDDDLERLVRRALMSGREKLPLTLLMLDEVQQFINNDPGQTLKVQTMVERLSSAFDGKLLVVATGQQALNDIPDLQKLLGRFPVTVALGDSDIDTVVRRTVLQKRPEAGPKIKAMLDSHAGEISRHLDGSRFAHTVEDNDAAVADWPLLPSRRRVWHAILAELDQQGLKGNLRGQLHSTLAAAQRYADRPLGHAAPADFLYERISDDAVKGNFLPRETNERIEKLRAGSPRDQQKARILMLIYMLNRISGDAERHGVRAKAEILADLMIEDLAGEPELRGAMPSLLAELAEDGSILEVEGGEWRLQTKASAEWEAAFRDEKRRASNDPAAVSRGRNEAIDKALGLALSGAGSVNQGRAAAKRDIHRLTADQPAPADGVPLRIHNGYAEDLTAAEAAIKSAATTDPAIHLLIAETQAAELRQALETRLAAEAVLAAKGVGATEDAGEARAAMENRLHQAEQTVRDIAKAAVAKAKVLQAGGTEVGGAPAEAVKAAALRSAARLYPRFEEADHPAWGTAFTRASRKEPDALKAVDHTGEPEAHPVAKTILADLGPGRTGRDIRSKFQAAPFGWPQDAIDASLLVLSTAGRVRATGEDGRPADPAGSPRQKLPGTTFRAETVVATASQKMAVRKLLDAAGVPYETNSEVAALPALLTALEGAARSSGGDAPAPAADVIPNGAALRTLVGADLLVKLAEAAPTLTERLTAWRSAERKISERLPRWRLAERLVRLGATDQESALDAVRTTRALLADPDPVAPLVQGAAESLRLRLNEAWTAWEAAWAAGQARLHDDGLWGRLTADQKHDIRLRTGLLEAERPKVDTPEAVAEALERRSLEAWQHASKALPALIGDALAEAAAELEPKARSVKLPGGLIKNTAELDTWLATVRERLVAVLGDDSPVIPEI